TAEGGAPLSAGTADDADTNLVKESHAASVEKAPLRALRGAVGGFVFRSYRRTHHRDPAPVPVPIETHDTLLQREEGPVATRADPGASVEVGAGLADDDVARDGVLAVRDLHTAVFRLGVAAVTRAALSFFMCHGGPR